MRSVRSTVWASDGLVTDHDAPDEPQSAHHGAERAAVDVLRGTDTDGGRTSPSACASASPTCDPDVIDEAAWRGKKSS